MVIALMNLLVKGRALRVNRRVQQLVGPGWSSLIPAHGFTIQALTIPLISNEPVNICEKRLFEHELAEFFHERPQSRLLHGWNELIMHAALTE